MKFLSLSSLLFSFCLLGLSSQETFAESNGQRIQLEDNLGKQVSYGLIEYSLQPTEKEKSSIFSAYINHLIALTLNFELTQTFDNLEVLATDHGFFIQYRTLSPEFSATSDRIIKRAEKLLRSGELDTYLDTARTNIRQQVKTSETRAYPKGPDGTSVLRAMNDEEQSVQRKRTEVVQYFQQRKERFSKNSNVRVLGQTSRPQKESLELTKSLDALERLPDSTIDSDEYLNQRSVIQPKVASITAIDDSTNNNQIHLRFVQGISSKFEASEQPAAMLAQLAVRDLQFGTLAKMLRSEEATVVPSEDALPRVNEWYELKVTCPNENVGKVVSRVRNQWQEWVRQGAKVTDLEAALSLARTKLAIAYDTPELQLRLKANHAQVLQLLPSKTKDDKGRDTNQSWIELMSERLRADLDPSRLNIEVQGNITGYTLNQLSAAFPEARLVVIRTE